MKIALLIVERDFLNTHVGVRQVILFYWRRLEKAGYQVRLATPVDGTFQVAKPLKLAEVVHATNRGRSDAPDWRSTDGPDVWERAVRDRRAAEIVKWSAERISTRDFSISIVTNPWLCANGFPDERFSAGIVYDMVPNLLACGALRLGTVNDVYSFANAHDIGYRIYQRRADTILAISESARADFLAFYSAEEELRAVTRVVIPFDPPAFPTMRARQKLPQERRKLLLVNVLDPRKNFATVERTVKLAMRDAAFDIDIVGRERMSEQDTRSFFAKLGQFGAHVRWYRTASDACLNRLYADADALLFPSFYEGLGLPILEAQAHGTPVISSNTSSCGEINLNPHLTFYPTDAELFARGILEIFADADRDVSCGPALVGRQREFLGSRNRLPVNWLQISNPAAA